MFDKMKIVQFISVLIFFKSTSALLFNGNSTWKDFAKCKEYDVSDGYNYQQYFRIDEFTQKAATEVDNSTMINIEIAVLAIRDAHILLTSSVSPSNDTPVYEIVLGAGGNTFSEIRRFRKQKPLKTKSTPNILSIIRPIPINIVYTRIESFGRLDVFTNGEPFPLLSYQDPSIVDTKYISFCSWGSAEAKWFYDCEPKEDSSTNSLAPVPKNLTAIQKLREKFWLFARFHLDEPETETNVTFKIEFDQIDYVLQNNLLTLRGIFSFKWYDFRNYWDPDEFDNITIYRGRVPIWYPYLSLVNSQTKETELDTGFRYILYNNGTVEAISKPIEINTWCLSEMRFNSWPNDDHYCTIKFGTRNKFVKFVPITLQDYAIKSDSLKWHIHSVEFRTQYEKDSFQQITNATYYDNDYTPHSFNVIVEFERNQDFFGKLFFTPLIASLVLISFSFWMHHPYRCGMSLIAIMIQIGVFLMMSKYTPHDYVPTIVQYYHFGLYFSWISIIFMIISLWYTKHPPENPPKLWILDVMDNSVLRKVLALGVLETSDDINGRQLPWIELTKIFDRILFILIIMFILIVLNRGY